MLTFRFRILILILSVLFVEIINSKYNILILLADDLGYGDLSVPPFNYYDSKTPHLEEMARNGLVLTNYHAAAPTCTPSRAALLTGLFPWRLGIYSIYGSSGMMADGHMPVVPNIASTLQRNGYYTAHVGKWHLGGMRSKDLQRRRNILIQHGADVPPYNIAATQTEIEEARATHAAIIKNKNNNKNKSKSKPGPLALTGVPNNQASSVNATVSFHNKRKPKPKPVPVVARSDQSHNSDLVDNSEMHSSSMTNPEPVVYRAKHPEGSSTLVRPNNEVKLRPKPIIGTDLTVTTAADIANTPKLVPKKVHREIQKQRMQQLMRVKAKAKPRPHRRLQDRSNSTCDVSSLSYAPGPLEHGFDEYVAMEEGHETVRRSALAIPGGILYTHGAQYLVHNDQRMAPSDDILTDRQANEAIRIMNNSVNSNKNFYLQVWFDAPHMPYQTLPPYNQAYNSNNIKNSKKYTEHSLAYLTMISSLDHAIGRILKYIDSNKLNNNTIIIFTSDNGPEIMAGSGYPFKGRKRSLQEGGLRVPFIVQWKGKVAPSTSSDVFVVGTDLFPTLLEAVGISRNSSNKIDGMSVYDLIIDQNNCNKQLQYKDSYLSSKPEHPQQSTPTALPEEYRHATQYNYYSASANYYKDLRSNSNSTSNSNINCKAERYASYSNRTVLWFSATSVEHAAAWKDEYKYMLDEKGEQSFFDMSGGLWNEQESMKGVLPGITIPGTIQCFHPDLCRTRSSSTGGSRGVFPYPIPDIPPLREHIIQAINTTITKIVSGRKILNINNNNRSDLITILQHLRNRIILFAKHGRDSFLATCFRHPLHRIPLGTKHFHQTSRQALCDWSTHTLTNVIARYYTRSNNTISYKPKSNYEIPIIPTLDWCDYPGSNKRIDNVYCEKPNY